MKYSESNKPIVCMQTNSTCYKGTQTMVPKGVLWHDTGAGNPYIHRYVQPMETDDNYEEMIALLGKNRYGNDWNHRDLQKGVNAFIGKLADGTVATVQALPWNYKPWGCGGGSKGSLNNTHMQFEICDDGMVSREYFEAVYKEACEITAYYCQMYNLDPLGTFVYKGVTVPVITSHDESYDLKLGNNHGDPIKWLKKYGKTMDNVRRDVAALMRGEEWPETPAPAPTPKPTPVPTPTPAPQGNAISLRTLSEGSTGDDVKALQILLTGMGCNCGNADGIFGAKTLAAVKKFQDMCGLVADGVVGILTWSKLLGV